MKRYIKANSGNKAYIEDLAHRIVEFCNMADDQNMYDTEFYDDFGNEISAEKWYVNALSNDEFKSEVLEYLDELKEYWLDASDSGYAENERFRQYADIASYLYDEVKVHYES